MALLGAAVVKAPTLLDFFPVPGTARNLSGELFVFSERPGLPVVPLYGRSVVEQELKAWLVRVPASVYEYFWPLFKYTVTVEWYDQVPLPVW